MIDNILEFLDKKYVEIISRLSEEERIVFEYFLRNISVGEIIAQKELKAQYGIENPREVIRRLIDIGLLEQGYGCYNLAKSLREAKVKAILKQLRSTLS